MGVVKKDTQDMRWRLCIKNMSQEAITATAMMVSIFAYLVRTPAVCGPSPYYHSSTPGVPDSGRMCDHIRIVIITVVGHTGVGLSWVSRYWCQIVVVVVVESAGVKAQQCVE
jgi:hypothetical protein